MSFLTKFIFGNDEKEVIDEKTIGKKRNYSPSKEDDKYDLSFSDECHEERKKQTQPRSCYVITPELGDSFIMKSNLEKNLSKQKEFPISPKNTEFILEISSHLIDLFQCLSKIIIEIPSEYTLEEYFAIHFELCEEYVFSQQKRVIFQEQFYTEILLSIMKNEKINKNIIFDNIFVQKGQYRNSTNSPDNGRFIINETTNTDKNTQNKSSSIITDIHNHDKLWISFDFVDHDKSYLKEIQENNSYFKKLNEKNTSSSSLMNDVRNEMRYHFKKEHKIIDCLSSLITTSSPYSDIFDGKSVFRFVDGKNNNYIIFKNSNKKTSLLRINEFIMCIHFLFGSLSNEISFTYVLNRKLEERLPKHFSNYGDSFYYLKFHDSLDKYKCLMFSE